MEEMTPLRSNKRSELSAPCASVLAHFGLTGVIGAVTGGVPVGKAVGGRPTGKGVGALTGAATGAATGTGVFLAFLSARRARPLVLAAATEAMIRGKNFMLSLCNNQFVSREVCSGTQFRTTDGAKGSISCEIFQDSSKISSMCDPTHMKMYLLFWASVCTAKYSSDHVKIHAKCAFTSEPLSLYLGSQRQIRFFPISVTRIFYFSQQANLLTGYDPHR
jgi:hypothetical protein